MNTFWGYPYDMNRIIIPNREDYYNIIKRLKILTTSIIKEKNFINSFSLKFNIIKRCIYSLFLKIITRFIYNSNIRKMLIK